MNRNEIIEMVTREVVRQLENHDPATEPAPPTCGLDPNKSIFEHRNTRDQDERTSSVQPSQRNPEAVRNLVAVGATRIGGRPGAASVPDDVAGYIDHTLLKPDASEKEITELCVEARDYHFASVCVNPGFVGLSAQLLRGSDVKVCTVVGFPLGATTSATKAFETRRAIREGAREIDMVINVGALKSGNLDLVESDIEAVVAAAHESGVICKVIIETALLSDEEKIIACILSKNAGADFVKTSTGFASGGATLRDIAMMRRTVGPNLGVKASGGIRNFEDAAGMIAAGATRIGASAGVLITKESRGESVAAKKSDGY